MALRKETPLQVFSCEFCKIFKSTTLRDTSRYDCFWIEYKYIKTKMRNIKHNYILLHFVQFRKQILLFIAVEDYNRSSRSQMFLKIVALKKFAIFTGKHLYWNNFMKKRLQHRCFSLNIANFLRKGFFYRASPVAASGHLCYFLSLLFLAFSISPLRSSYRKCSIRKAVLKVLQYSQENTYIGVSF